MFPFMGGILDATPPETVSLSGTELAPISNSDIVFDDPGPVAAIIAISAVNTGNNLSRGYIEWDAYVSGVMVSYSPIQAWVSPLDFQDGPYYFRWNIVTGNSPNDTPTTVNSVVNTWLPLTNGANSYFWNWETTSLITYKGATLKFEIATDSGGSNIIATGYYETKVKREL